MAFQSKVNPFYIEEFSNFVCFVLPEKIILPPGYSLNSFPIGVNAERLKLIMEHFEPMFNLDYSSIMVKLKDPKKGAFNLFMKAVMARCLKISEEPVDYGHFLMACSLIHRISAEYLGTTDCFLASNLCYRCFVSLYNRCYKEYFESKEGTGDTLDLYIEDLLEYLNEKSTEPEWNKRKSGGMSKAQTIMESLVCIEYESIPLTEYELEPVENNTCSVSKQHLPVLRTLSEMKNDSAMKSDSATPGLSSTCMSSVSCVSKQPGNSSAAESTVPDFQKASTSAAADKAEEVDSETESEKRTVTKRPVYDPLRYYRNIGYKPKRKRLSKPEISDESSSSSSNMELDEDEDRMKDMYYFGNLLCKYCQSRCSGNAVHYIDRFCNE